jgi:SAM-dependent methyltransferase
MATNRTPGFTSAVSGSSETEAVHYPADGSAKFFAVEDSSFWFKHRNEVLSEAVQEFVPEGRVLDVGGGNGFVSRRLETDGRSVVLIEPSSEGVRNARSRGVKNAIVGTLKTHSFESDSFAGIGLFDVLEHLENPEETLQEAARVLQPNGVLILTVPAMSALWSNADVEAGHFRRYNKPHIEKELRESGLSVCRITYFFALFVIPLGLMRCLPERLGRSPRGSEGDYEVSNRYAGKIIDSILRIEKKWLTSHRLIFGTSLLVIAKKNI